MRHFFLIPVLIICGTASGNDIDWEFDRDLSCCLQEAHLREHVIIALETEEQPIGHMALTTPENIQIGINLNDIQYFIPPKKQGIYALGPRPNTSIMEKKWDFSRYIVLFKRIDTSHGYFQYEKLNRHKENDSKYKLPYGKYKLQIKGTHPGNYKIIIYPNGIDDSTTALYSSRDNTTQIKTDELHTILFNVNGRGEIELLDSIH